MRGPLGLYKSAGTRKMILWHHVPGAGGRGRGWAALWPGDLSVQSHNDLCLEGPHCWFTALLLLS